MWFAGRPGGLVLVAEGWLGLRLVANLLLGGASGGCGFAALGVALYAGSPAQASAAVLFAGFGFVAGLMCGGLHAVFEGLPTPPAATMPAEVLASLVRATLASAVAERAPRSGSAADRRPSPAQWARAALADAAATSMGVPASASTAVGTAANTAAGTAANTAVGTAASTAAGTAENTAARTAASTAASTAANTVDALPTMARSLPPVAAVVPAAPPQPVDRRRFTRSEFGA